jgi:hypothetical protein
MAVIKGTKVNKVPVFKAVVVSKALKRPIKYNEKKRLIIIAFGILESIFFLNFLFKNIIGAKKMLATKNLNKVREIESITPDNFADAIKEPATRKVANNTNK